MVWRDDPRRLLLCRCSTASQHCISSVECLGSSGDECQPCGECDCVPEYRPQTIGTKRTASKGHIVGELFVSPIYPYLTLSSSAPTLPVG